MYKLKKPTTLLGISFFLLAAGLIFLGLSFIPANADEDKPVININPRLIRVIKLNGPISPATAGYVESSIKKAHEANAQALLIEIDTPGGLGESMRTIVKAILNAPLPIIIYVAPSGAQAASAGVMITMAADVAAMAPGTNIGAAHPVSAEGKDIQGDMATKVLNDMVAMAQSIAQYRDRNAEWAEKAVTESVSVSAKEAVELNVVDLIAESREDLLQQLDGRKIKRQGLDMELRTAGAEIDFIEESTRDKILKALANPNVAYILMMLGLAGLYFELSNPGAIFPGVVGGLFIILAFYSFQTLPVNYAGVLLIVLAIVFFILELKVTSFGMLSIAGLVSLTLGSLMLFESPEQYLRVSLRVILPMVALVGGFFIAVSALVVKAHFAGAITGADGLIGLSGKVREWEHGQGRIFVNGEWWNARGDDALEPGSRVKVLSIDGLNLTVQKLDAE